MTNHHMRRRIRGLLGAAGTAAVLALGSAPAITASAATVHHAVRHHAVAASETENRRTITVRSGNRVTLTLHSTYWSIQGSSDPKVLHQVGGSSTRPAKPGTCVPGQGCGTVSASFIAVSRGNADLTASRTTCGEALRCTPVQGDYVVHIVVAG
ncbi:MAG TPA: hypothetical protein VGP96_08380 [Candidatus Dormibacteraeota bacterium]|nr:hypothetical protein [Candidatus Dormibacteraeota bacterium]